MSPEQARAFLQGDCLVDRRSDVWALGAIFFELLTAQRPFGTRPKRECLASADDWSKAIESYLAPRTRDSGPSIVGCADMGIPEALRTIVERCVEKRPDAHFQSAGELTQALRSGEKAWPGRSRTRESAEPLRVATVSEVFPRGQAVRGRLHRRFPIARSGKTRGLTRRKEANKLTPPAR